MVARGLGATMVKCCLILHNMRRRWYLHQRRTGVAASSCSDAGSGSDCDSRDSRSESSNHCETDASSDSDSDDGAGGATNVGGSTGISSVQRPAATVASSLRTPAATTSTAASSGTVAPSSTVVDGGAPEGGSRRRRRPRRQPLVLQDKYTEEQWLALTARERKALHLRLRNDVVQHLWDRLGSTR
eukprot:GHVU01128279.1.p1 GENE.GHVU01128279.1~~GHVU01128279.1.p1  ORF type:complete len:186 (-),score=14.68 GHVU01128279.1:476-1033(-)